MFSLFRPVERRMWQALAGMLAISFILLLGAMQFPWYEAVYRPSEASEVRGTFSMDSYDVSVFNEGAQGRAYPAQIYDDDGAFGQVMSWTQRLMQAAFIGLLAFGGTLAAYYYGYLENPRWVVTSWVGSLLFLVIGLMYFSTQVADAAVVQLETMASRAQFYIDRPDAQFWGTQRLGSGPLESSPGAGWLLALVALLDLVMAFVVLFQFPRAAAELDEAPPGTEAADYALDEEELGNPGAQAPG